MSVYTVWGMRSEKIKIGVMNVLLQLSTHYGPETEKLFHYKYLNGMEISIVGKDSLEAFLQHGNFHVQKSQYKIR